jgi:hypothetical protein
MGNRQETKTEVPLPKKEILKFYPHIYEKSPEFSSPSILEDGTEIITAITKDNKFTIIPVTVKKGESLGYRDAEWDTIGILKVDATDFPTLARTGLHSEIELESTRWITGRSIAEITDSGRPGGSSGAGFMSQKEDIVSVLKGDNRLVKKLGLTHPQLAKPLFHIWNILRWVSHKRRGRGRSLNGIDFFVYNNKKVKLVLTGGRGWQLSIFNDEIKGMYQFEFSRELDEEEKKYLRKNYAHLNDREMTELIKKLSHIQTGEMAPFYIMRYGFYEGHTGYRADPIASSFILGLKSVEEIGKAFKENLYDALTGHFSREENVGGEEK